MNSVFLLHESSKKWDICRKEGTGAQVRTDNPSFDPHGKGFSH
jgi:hypothetical protein